MQRAAHMRQNAAGKRIRSSRDDDRSQEYPRLYTCYTCSLYVLYEKWEGASAARASESCLRDARSIRVSMTEAHRTLENYIIKLALGDCRLFQAMMKIIIIMPESRARLKRTTKQRVALVSRQLASHNIQLPNGMTMQHASKIANFTEDALSHIHIHIYEHHINERRPLLLGQISSSMRIGFYLLYNPCARTSECEHEVAMAQWRSHRIESNLDSTPSIFKVEARRRPDSIYIHAHCTTRMPEKKMPKRVQKTTYFRSVTVTIDQVQTGAEPYLTSRSSERGEKSNDKIYSNINIPFMQRLFSPPTRHANTYGVFMDKELYTSRTRDVTNCAALAHINFTRARASLLLKVIIHAQSLQSSNSQRARCRSIANARCRVCRPRSRHTPTCTKCAVQHPTTQSGVHYDEGDRLCTCDRFNGTINLDAKLEKRDEQQRADSLRAQLPVFYSLVLHNALFYNTSRGMRFEEKFPQDRKKAHSEQGSIINRSQVHGTRTFIACQYRKKFSSSAQVDEFNFIDMRRLGVQGLIFFQLGEPPILYDAIVDCRIPFFQSRLLRGHTLLASPPELDIFFRTRCLVPSCECGSRFCRRWQVPQLLCRLHLVSVVLASGATLKSFYPLIQDKKCKHSP
ncbi:unnamed protein product, partial [Trichogramma brassicae]